MLKIIISIMFLSLTGIVAFFIFLNYILHKMFYLPHIRNAKTPKDFNLTFKNIFIKTANDKKIQIWDLNPQKEAPVIIGVHGWANSSDKLLPIANKLTQNWRVFLLNTRNHGDSDDESYITIIKYQEDIIKTIDYVCNELDTLTDIILMGHSLGGAAVLYAAAEDPRIKGVITLSTFADLETMMKLSFIKRKMPESMIGSMLKYIEFRTGVKLKRVSPLLTIKKFKGPALIIHGTKDTTVDYTDLTKIMKSADRDNVQQFIMKGHTHSSILEEMELAVEIDRFLSKYFNTKRTITS